jgi:hypothetical protein
VKYFLYLAFLFPLTLHARLGWTIEQCKKEYGVIVQAETNGIEFKTQGGRSVKVIIGSDGKVDAFQIMPLNNVEAMAFRKEVRADWTREIEGDSLLPKDKSSCIVFVAPRSSEAKGKAGELTWRYNATNQIMIMTTSEGEALLAEDMASTALSSPLTSPVVPVSAKEMQETKSQQVGLRSIRRIFVGNLGQDADSLLTQERIRKELIKSGRFTVVSDLGDAQAAINGAVSVKGFTYGKGSSYNGQGFVKQNTAYQANAVLRVVGTSSGSTLWTWEFKPTSFYVGGMPIGDSDVAECFVRDFTKIVFGSASTSSGAGGNSFKGRNTR